MMFLMITFRRCVRPNIEALAGPLISINEATVCSG